MEWDRIRDNWEQTLIAVAKLGGDVRPLVIEPPASEREVVEIERKLGNALPTSLRTTLLTFSKHVEFRWYLPENFPLPPELRGIFCGEWHWSLEWLAQFNEDKNGWIKTVFSNPADNYDKVWHNKLAFQEVPNGDYVALDLSNSDKESVVYLSHDGGEGHGYQMAADFQDLFHRWTPLGCPGPEDWQWLPFTNSKTSYIDPNSSNAILWKKVLGW